QEPLTPPDELALLELDVHADLSPVVSNHFAHLHELRQLGAWGEDIGRFEPIGVARLGQQGFGTLRVVPIVFFILRLAAALKRKPTVALQTRWRCRNLEASSVHSKGSATR